MSSFFNAIKQYITVNPQVVESTVWAGKFRTPAPASQTPHVAPQRYQYKNAAISGNYYYTRDSRRNYPKTTVYTNQEWAPLLLGSGYVKSLPAPNSVETTNLQPTVSYSISHLPPSPPSPFKKKVWLESTDSGLPSHDSSKYFPIGRHWILLFLAIS
ncbi:hypothetical protein BKA69DRAFT_68420 [Paraphysoderma sedebokerense]|nr:hypothetical protein BKA69DRAFT_68420 [Paraphysoderma sedebokerense]